MKIEIDSGFDFDDAGTGGKFRESERAFKRIQRETEARKAAFMETARKQIEEGRRVKQNKNILGSLVKKMQKSGININLSTAQKEQFHYAYIDKLSLDSLSILTICDRQFLLLMSNEHKIYVANAYTKEGSKYSPTSSSFSDQETYSVINTQDPNDIDKWAWGIFNTAIECNSLPHLKTFFGTP